MKLTPKSDIITYIKERINSKPAHVRPAEIIKIAEELKISWRTVYRYLKI
jgi:predicted transcriptional regulator YheO